MSTQIGALLKAKPMIEISLEAVENLGLWENSDCKEIKGSCVVMEIFHILIDCGGDFMTINIFENLSDSACTSKQSELFESMH